MKGTEVKGIEEYLPVWNNDIAFLQEILDNQFGEGMFHIDEVALMFNSKADVWHWLEEQLPKAGVELFNVAKDHVHTYPFHTEYDVHYYFLNTPGDYYRVECMAIGGMGLSPLHEAIKYTARNNPSGLKPTVHYSFKCRDEGEYGRVVQWLANAEFAHVQSCVSTYGLFSYWLLSEYVNPDGKFDVYLKPRVNTRDTITVDDPITITVDDVPISEYLSPKAGR
jgi:hypothetical protein